MNIFVPDEDTRMFTKFYNKNKNSYQFIGWVRASRSLEEPNPGYDPVFTAELTGIGDINVYWSMTGFEIPAAEVECIPAYRNKDMFVCQHLSSHSLYLTWIDPTEPFYQMEADYGKLL